MECKELTNDLLQFEALLIARSYLYTLFSKVCGGVPDEEMLAALTSPVTRDVLDEYARAPEVEVLLSLLTELSAAAESERNQWLSDAKDEYTRVFLGPGALPASPYESPYRGSHDMALFQENTIVVRREYESQGLKPRRIYAVPDDHISLLCAFMGVLSTNDLEILDKGRFEVLREHLTYELQFAQNHLMGWVNIFAESVDTSTAGSKRVFYAKALSALDAYINLDISFLKESIYWIGEEQPRETPFNEDLGRIRQELHGIDALSPFGIDDYRLVSIDTESET